MKLSNLSKEKKKAKNLSLCISKLKLFFDVLAFFVNSFIFKETQSGQVELTP